MTLPADLPPITPGLVSIIVPMRNARTYVGEAVRSLLCETQVPIEVIVVDDGSTDGSADEVRSLGDERVRVISGPCKGNIPSTLNAGLTEARGEYLMRCDADDAFEPGRIAWQARWLADHPDYVALCGTFVTTEPDGTELSAMHRNPTAQDVTDEMHRGVTRTHFGTFAVRMAVARQIGGFRPYFTVAEDLDFQLRVASVGRVWFEPRSCYRYRLHAASITHTQASVKREFLTQAARDFAVQRAQTGTDDLARGRPPTPPADDAPASCVHGEMQRLLISRAWAEHRGGDRRSAVRHGWRACVMRPGNPRGWWSLFMLFVKRPGGAVTGHA